MKISYHQSGTTLPEGNDPKYFAPWVHTVPIEDYLAKVIKLNQELTLWLRDDCSIPIEDFRDRYSDTVRACIDDTDEVYQEVVEKALTR